MCGIAGLLRLDGAPVDRRVLERMTRTLSRIGVPMARISGLMTPSGLDIGDWRFAISVLTQPNR